MSEIKSEINAVARIRNHPLVLLSISVYGLICDVKTNKLNEVKEATAIGKSK
jgi:carbonic anhydrase